MTAMIARLIPLETELRRVIRSAPLLLPRYRIIPVLLRSYQSPAVVLLATLQHHPRKRSSKGRACNLGKTQPSQHHQLIPPTRLTNSSWWTKLRRHPQQWRTPIQQPSCRTTLLVSRRAPTLRFQRTKASKRRESTQCLPLLSHLSALNQPPSALLQRKLWRLRPLNPRLSHLR